METEPNKDRGAAQEDDLKTILEEVNELLERRDKLLDGLNSLSSEPSREQFFSLASEALVADSKVQKLKKLAEEKLYPPNPPNRSCGHAIVGGILFYNTAGLKRGDYERLFEFGHEIAYVWTHTRHEYSALVTEVDRRAREEGVWKTLGCCLRIAMAFRSNLEYPQPAEEFSYCWAYYFDPEKSLEEQKLMNPDSASVSGAGVAGEVNPLRFLEEIAPILELLGRDERYFVASQHLLASVDSHYFCLTCALQREGYKMHPNHEPDIWEVVETIPRMEVAIVQATRAVEAILGKPGKKEDPKKLARAIERWKASLDLDPNETFELAGKTYIDYYYDLFGTRGNAAHSLGKLPYYVSRQLTIEAQCFAWLVLWRYFQSHSLDQREAAEALRLNRTLWASEPENFFTKLTDDPE